MKIANQLRVSLIPEGINLLKVYPGHRVGRTWSRPVSVNFLITSRCNSKCITCDSWVLKDHEHELTTDDFRRLAREIAELGIPIVTIGGGEPTLRDDLVDIICAMKEAGRIVQLTTNALTLGQKQRIRLYESGLDRITVSIDSHIPSLYRTIRGVDGAERTLKNLATLLAEGPAELAVDTNTVLCSENAETFLQTLDHLLGMGVPRVSFSAVTTSVTNYLMRESKQGLAAIPSELVQSIIDGLMERRRKTRAISASSSFIKGLARYYEHPDRLVYPCYAGYLTLDVFQNGAIHGCGNLPAFANVREGSLKKIWQGAAAQENRTRMAEGRCPNCYLSCKAELAIAADPLRLPGFAVDKLIASL